MPTVLITGGHKGLGLEAARRIAAAGGRDLLLGGRDIAEVEAAAAGLRHDYGVRVGVVVLDLSSLASVRSAVTEVRRLIASGAAAPLDTLVLNAGAQFLGPVALSVDGIELTFATNCLGHFLLLNLLLDDLEQGGRVVFTASGTHDPETMDGRMVGRAAAPDARMLARQGQAGEKEAALSGGVRYATSKLCTVMYAYELGRRLGAADADIASIAFCPGLIVETGLIRSAPSVAQRLIRTRPLKILMRLLGVSMGTIPFSGGALADVAIAPGFAGASGTYMQSRNGRLTEARSSRASYDAAAAERLWADSEALAGLKPQERPRLLSGSAAAQARADDATGTDAARSARGAA